ncbi:MAG: MATE family efflux transporter, partial [Lachnospiraceae bacterium]|nr:MATE family efflux transporter [Lachnospiraceae bacterium]
MKELTKGYQAKVILLFAFPLMASCIFQQLYNMIDAKIVSAYVGTNAFAAIGATAVVSNMIIGFINGLTQGFAIPIANSFGANNFEKIRRFVAGAIILTFSAAVIFTAA